MKTVLAQGRKDLVAASVLLWVWGACVGIDCLCFLDRFAFHPASFNEKDFIVLFGSLLGGMTIALTAFVAQALLAIILLVRIVQADLLTDSSAFWRTRPIARYELLAEKTMFAVLFVAGGFLAGSAIHLGAPGGPSGRAVLNVLVFGAGLFAFAAVTADFSKFIIAFLGLAWGAQIVAAILLVLLKYLAVSAGIAATSWPLATPSLFASEQGHLVISVFYLLAFAAIIIWQYLTLQTRIARALLFATFLLATCLQGGSRVQFHSSRTSHVRGP